MNKNFITLIFILTGCGLSTEDSELGSIDNYLSSESQTLSCGKQASLDASGKFNKSMTPLVPAAKRVKYDKSLTEEKKAELQHFVQAALTSVPKEFQDLFIHHNGVIRITPKIATHCPKSNIEKMAEGNTRRIDSCYSLLKHKETGVGSLNIIINSSKESIGHGTLRAFSFMMSEFFSRVQLQGKKSTYLSKTPESVSRALAGLNVSFKQEYKNLSKKTLRLSPERTLAEAMDSIFCKSKTSDYEKNRESYIRELKNDSNQKKSKHRNTANFFYALFPKTSERADGIISRLKTTIRKFLIANKARQKSLSLTTTTSQPTTILGDTISASTPTPSASSFVIPSQSTGDSFSSSDFSQPISFNESSFGHNTISQPQVQPNSVTQPFQSQNSIASNSFTDPDQKLIIINNYDGGNVHLPKPLDSYSNVQINSFGGDVLGNQNWSNSGSTPSFPGSSSFPQNNSFNSTDLYDLNSGLGTPSSHSGLGQPSTPSWNNGSNYGSNFGSSSGFSDGFSQYLNSNSSWISMQGTPNQTDSFWSSTPASSEQNLLSQPLSLGFGQPQQQLHSLNQYDGFYSH